MARDESHSSEYDENSVTSILRRHLQPGTRSQILDCDPTLNLGLHNLAVYLIGKIAVGPKEAWSWHLIGARFLCLFDCGAKNVDAGWN